MVLKQSKKYLITWRRPRGKVRAFVGIYLDESKHFYYFKMEHRTTGVIHRYVLKAEQVPDTTPCGVRHIKL